MTSNERILETKVKVILENRAHINQNLNFVYSLRELTYHLNNQWYAKYFYKRRSIYAENKREYFGDWGFSESNTWRLEIRVRKFLTTLDWVQKCENQPSYEEYYEFEPARMFSKEAKVCAKD